MKTIKSLLCLAACSVGLIGGVNAATLEIEGGSAQGGVEKNTVKVKLKDEDLSNYNKVEFQLTVSNPFYAQITSFSPASGLGLSYTYSQSGEIITYTFDAGEGTLSEKELGTIEFRTSSEMDNNFAINFANAQFYKKEDSSILKPGDSGVKAVAGNITYIRPKSSEAILTALAVNSGTLTPNFESTVTEYKVQVKDTLNFIRIAATPCAGATVTGDVGSKQIEQGENEFEITVTSEDETSTITYKLTVIRGEIAEPSAYIKDLVINNIGATLSPNFDSKNNKYTITIGKEIDELDFKYTLEDPMADVKIEGNKDFVVGENLVKITVTSSDQKDEQIYEITVIKEEEEENEPPVDTDKPQDEEKKKPNIWLIVGIVAGILLIVVGVTIVLFKKKKKKKVDDAKLPLKRREGSEKTVEIDQVGDRPKHAAPEFDSTETVPKREYPSEEESITEILKSELYENDKTQRFDSDEFEDLKHKIYEEDDDIDQTKEFNFKDFE